MAVIKITELPSSIDLGNEIENETKSIQFDVSDWDTLFPGYDYHITVKRPGDSGNWPVTGVTHSDGILTWIVPNTVTSVPGQGSFVIHCVKDGKEKNVSCWYFVTDGHEAQGDPPDPVTDWVANAAAKLSEVDHFVDETIEATENANTATGLANNAAELANTKAGLANGAAALANTKAGEANSAATSANTAAGRADTIAGTLEGIAPKWAAVDISASGLAAGAAPTASIAQDETGTSIALGIPKGDTGASITQAAFVGDDLVFTKDDAGTVALANAKPDLTGPQGPIGNVMYATFDIDFDTGELVMTIPDGYTGPTFSINNETGELEVSI